MIDLTIGADPELFLFDGESPISAYGEIPGSKENPYKVPHGAVQVDGMALEFNIDPAKSEDEFVNNIKEVMGHLQRMVGNRLIMPVSVAHFGEEYIANQPANAVRLGCDPDYNAWADGLQNPQPDGGLGFRTGAGHIHIGWGHDIDVYNPDHLDACIMATKQLDATLGIASLVLDKGGKTRREMYGKAGAFRTKPYGVEYRVLSNFWLQSEALMRWVYQATTIAINALLNGHRLYDSEYDLEGIINSPELYDGIGLRHFVRKMAQLGIVIPEV